MPMPVTLTLLAILHASPVCEKPANVMVPVLAPIECARYSEVTRECAAACYWPGRPDGGAWDDVVKAFAPTKEACYRILKEICAKKRGRPR